MSEQASADEGSDAGQDPVAGTDSTPDDNSVLLSISDGLAEITLNRPSVMNSLNDEMVTRFHDVLEQIEARGDIRAVLITGSGRAFSAGRDLSDASPLEEDAEAILAELFNPLIARIRAIPVPTLAAVNGAALGVGFGIAMACDMAIASEKAKLGSPFAGIGCVLDSGGHRAMVERIGPHRTLDLIYTSRLLTGGEAAEMGLVNRSLPADELLLAVRQQASTIASGPTAAFAASKRIVHAIMDDGLDFSGSLTAEAQAQGALAGQPDYVEGIQAFMDKRKPSFKGR